MVQQGILSPMPAAGREREKPRQRVPAGGRVLNECMGGDEFAQLCRATLTSTATVSDSVVSQTEYARFVNELPCLFMEDEAVACAAEAERSRFADLPLSLQLRFVAAVCRHVDDEDADGRDCMNNLVLKRLDADNFGFLFNSSDEDAMTNVQGLCEGMYGHILDEGFLPMCADAPSATVDGERSEKFTTGLYVATASGLVFVVGLALLFLGRRIVRKRPRTDCENRDVSANGEDHPRKAFTEDDDPGLQRKRRVTFCLDSEARAANQLAVAEMAMAATPLPITMGTGAEQLVANVEKKQYGEFNFFMRLVAIFIRFLDCFRMRLFWFRQ